jgi:hypothetical protein
MKAHRAGKKRDEKEFKKEGEERRNEEQRNVHKMATRLGPTVSQIRPCQGK